MINETNKTMIESGGVGPKVLESVNTSRKTTSVQSVHVPTLFLAFVKVA